MLSVLRRLFPPLVFPDDEDKTRTAFMLNAILWMIVGFVLVGNFALLGLDIANPVNVVITMCFLLGVFILQQWVRDGRFSLVGVVLSSLIMIVTGLLVFNWGTIRALQVGYLLIAFGFPTLLLSRRLGLVFLGLSIGFVYVFVQFELAGWMPERVPPTPLNQWMVFSLVSSSIYVFLALARWNAVDALAKARYQLAARQRSEKRMHLVADILRNLNAVPSVSQVFPEIADQLQLLTGCQIVGLVFVNPDGQTFRITDLDHPQGVISVGLTLRLDETAASANVRAGCPHLAPDLSLATDHLVEAWLYRVGFRSMVTVPMREREHLVGALSLVWKGVNAYDEADVPMLTQVADALALAIARSRSFDEAQRRVQEADTLRQVSAILTDTLDQEKASRLILEQLQRVVPHNSASVMLLRDGYLEIIGGRGWDGVDGIIGLRFPIFGDNPNSCVIETRQTLMLDDAPSVYPLFAQPPFNAVGPILSWLGIPLIFQARIIGMMTLDSLKPAAFTPEHVRLCSAFADQVAVVLENTRLYAEARQRAVALEESVHEMEHFSYTLSHDLRAPLRAIDGYAHIFLDEKGAELDAESLRYVHQMATNARQMGRLLDDLLAFIRLGRHKLHRQPVQLADLAQQVVAELKSKIDGSPVEVHVGELPTWPVDAFLFRQVFRELLANALQFTQAPEVQNPAKIEVGIQQTPQGEACFVRDNGIGFDMSYQDNLFRVFHRLHVTDSEDESTGVGLALAQRVIQQHGGRIWAESTPGQGATFYFTIGM
jgi:signal transduction histidine kinase